MGIVVQKFGGSSVSNIENLFIVCKHIIKEYDKGNDVVVVISAQGHMTDTLVKEESEITNEPNLREHDVLLSTGEQISASKLVMCLNKLKYEAISFMGWQIPIITDENYGDAKILDIDISKIKENIAKRKIVVVAGFQGITKNNDITTLGRGGSDTTAVVLASFLKANEVYIFKDVDGIYSDDPNKNKQAVKYKKISYDQMLEMANNGAKVLHNKSVEFAKTYNVPIIVKSTFTEDEGTIVTNY